MYLSPFWLVRSFSVRLLITAMFWAIFESIFGSYVAQAQLSEAGRLSVSLTGLRNLDGQVCLSLFDRSAGFPDDETAAVAQQCVDAGTVESLGALPEVSPEASTAESSAEIVTSESVLSVTFEDLVPGNSYAVSVLHDENRDGELNQGTFGIPIEGFGFSRNPQVQTSAPEFYESAVLVFGETTTSIEMIYF